MDALLKLAADRAIRYLDALDERPVAPSAEAVAGLSAFDMPLPEYATEPDTVVRLLDELGSPATVGTAGSRFFGFVIGGVLPASLAAHWLAAAWDQNTAFSDFTPATSRLERISLGWLVDLLGLPAGTGAGFVTGATVANLTALAAARHAVLAKAGWDVEADGLFGAPPVTVVVGAEAHPSLFKALGLLGFGRRRVVTIPADDQGRLRAEALPPLDGPAIVCA